MRYMIIIKANADSEAGALPQEDMLKAMADYHEQLQQAGVLVDGNGLKRSADGWRIEWKAGRKLIVDGPFAETKELIAGYTVIKVKSREEALRWTSQFPNPHNEDCHIEIRQLFELDDFAQTESLERMREMKLGAQGSE